MEEITGRITSMKFTEKTLSAPAFLYLTFSLEGNGEYGTRGGIELFTKGKLSNGMQQSVSVGQLLTLTVEGTQIKQFQKYKPKPFNVWFVSDLHLGHEKVSGIRGFYNEDVVEYQGEGSYACAPDTEAHDDQLAANWDRVVQPNDVVYVLGDISAHGSQQALDWIAGRPGTKHLISGNHDPVHPMYRDSQKHLSLWLTYFETIQTFLSLKLGGKLVLLSHFPYWSYGDGPAREGRRYEQYRLPDCGEILLHGHTHGKEKDHENSFHVGVDAWDMELVPLATVVDWIAQKQA